MASLYISEFRAFGPSVVPKGPSVADQKVAIGGTSAQSSAFNNETGMVVLHTDAICSFLIGGNPTATANNMRMAANETRGPILVNPGDKIAVITNT